MTEAPEPAAEPATPTTDGLAGLLAAVTEQTLASMSPEAFNELVQRVRPPDETVQQPSRPPSRMPVVPTEPTEQQQRDHELYRNDAYPTTWGFHRSEESK